MTTYPPGYPYVFAKPKPKIIPNLPDVVLRQIFSLLNYKQVCQTEGVCRRWQTIIHQMMRRDIHEITLDRFSMFPKTDQCKAFRRLSVSCSPNSLDFLSGVLRRSRLSIMKMTSDIEFLANIDKIRVNKDEKRKYFSNCEELWILMIGCSDNLVQNFLNVEGSLFNSLHTITIQIHVNPSHLGNVARVVRRLMESQPNATYSIELHARTSKEIFDQLSLFPAHKYQKIKLICTEFELPQLRLDRFYTLLKEQKLEAKNITIRDWSLYTDGGSPVSHIPMETFRISSCSIETVDNLVESLRLTAQQDRPKLNKRVVKRKKEATEPTGETDEPKKKVIKKVVKKKKPPPYIKRLEIAGQCTLLGLQFLQNRAHTELEKRLGTSIPDMEVDCSEIYYCF